MACNQGISWQFGVTSAGARQCVAAVSGVNYQLSTQIFIEAGQGAGSAAIELAFFPNDACAGTPTGVFDSTAITTTGSWTSVSGFSPAPNGSASMVARLMVSKAFRDPAFRAIFDNVVVRRSP